MAKKEKNTTVIDEIELDDVKVEDVIIEDEKGEPELVVRVEYSKYNPFVLNAYNHTHQKHKSLYNTYKYLLALTLGIFLLIGLWLSTIWQLNTMEQLGIPVRELSALMGDNGFTPEQILAIFGSPATATADAVYGFGIFDFKGAGLDSGWLTALIVFGWLSIFTIFPMLLFKNGTAWSLGFLGLGTVMLIVVMVLLFMGISAQYNLIVLTRKINLILGQGENASQYLVETYFNELKEYIFGATV
ncbi:MAG: hypothetical protein ACRCVI_02175 [Mycoplasmoidaceae bacterium]